MKLYTKPGACSTAVHISLRWSGLAFEVEILDATTMKAPAYLALNPAGAVPLLVDGDFVLNQNAAILGYIADQAPAAGLAGDGSARQRAEANRWLAFVNSDLHPAFKPLFMPANYIGDDSQYDPARPAARTRVRALSETAERQLGGQDRLAGFRSYADPYLHLTLRWAGRVGVDLGGLPQLAAFQARMDADPGVQAVLRAEGLAGAVGARLPTGQRGADGRRRRPSAPEAARACPLKGRRSPAARCRRIPRPWPWPAPGASPAAARATRRRPGSARP